MNRLVDWHKFLLDRIDWVYLSENPAPEAITLLLANPDNIDWDLLSANPAPGAIKLLLANRQEINWDMLSTNPAPEAVELLLANRREINWDMLSANPARGAIELLLDRNKSPTPTRVGIQWEGVGWRQDEEINWSELSSNHAPGAIKMLLENQGQIDWSELSANKAPRAVELLLENLENPDNNINWDMLSKNPAPEALKLLLKNEKKINWYWLSANPAPEALELLAANFDKIKIGWKKHWNALGWEDDEDDDDEDDEGGWLRGAGDFNYLDLLSANPGLFKVIEFLEENELLGKEQRFAFSKSLLLSNTFPPPLIQKILEDKKPTPRVQLANIRLKRAKYTAARRENSVAVCAQRLRASRRRQHWMSTFFEELE